MAMQSLHKRNKHGGQVDPPKIMSFVVGIPNLQIPAVARTPFRDFR